MKENKRKMRQMRKDLTKMMLEILRPENGNQKYAYNPLAGLLGQWGMEDQEDQSDSETDD